MSLLFRLTTVEQTRAQAGIPPESDERSEWELTSSGLQLKPARGKLTPSWSRNNRFLLSTSLDGTAIIWDLAALSPLLRPRTVIAPWARDRTLRFDAPLASGSLHPRNAGILLITLAVSEVVLVDLRGRSAGEGGTRWVLEDVMEGEGDETGDGEEGMGDDEARGKGKKK